MSDIEREEIAKMEYTRPTSYSEIPNSSEAAAWSWENHGRQVTVDKAFADELISDGEIVRPLIFGDTHPASADDSKHHAVSQGVTGAGDGGQHIDDIAVDRFAEAMKQKLAKQRQKGYGGWNDKELCPDGRLQKYLGAHLGKGDPVDIGNFAMMIWNRGESVTDAGVPDADYIRALQDAFDINQAPV